MRTLLAATAVVLGLWASGWAQEGKRDGERERREERSIPLKDVDTNNDGRATLSELQAALEKALREGGERKEEGKKKRD